MNWKKQTSVRSSARRKWMYWLSRRDEPNAFLSLDCDECHGIDDDGGADDEKIGMIRLVLILDR